jgi:hypothetical protein
MKDIQVTAYSIVDFEYGDFFASFDCWTFSDFRNHSDALHKWLGITTVMYCSEDGLVHCGLERFDNDILYTFDPQAKAFRSLRFFEHADRYDVKIHSLTMTPEGVLYGGEIDNLHRTSWLWEITPR